MLEGASLGAVSEDLKASFTSSSSRSKSAFDFLKPFEGIGFVASERE